MEKHPISFARDIRPLFRTPDIEHMAGMDVLLDDYTFMSNPENARAVYDYVSGAKQPQMPPGGPYWNEQQLNLFSQWISDGLQP